MLVETLVEVEVVVVVLGVLDEMLVETLVEVEVEVVDVVLVVVKFKYGGVVESTGAVVVNTVGISGGANNTAKTAHKTAIVVTTINTASWHPRSL